MRCGESPELDRRRGARGVHLSVAERLGDFEEGRAISALVKGERAQVAQVHSIRGLTAFHFVARSYASATRSVVASS